MLNLITSQDANSVAPRVFVKDGEVFASSRDIAEAFGKEHRNVVQAIENLAESLIAENSAVGFFEVLDPHPTVRGRMIRSFDTSGGPNGIPSP